MSIFIKNIKCENTVNPLGIGTETPVFSWQLTSDKNGVSQSAYSVTVSDHKGQVIYESGKIQSDNQFNIKVDLRGKLTTFQRYDYTVCVWDNEDNAAAPAHGHFLTGVFKTHQWCAEWFKIWYVFGCVGYARKEFEIYDEEIDYAYCFIGAVGEKVNSVSAFLNGKRIGDNIIFPGATEYFRAFFSAFDIKDLLISGTNTAGMLISKCASLIIKIKYKSGREQFVCSLKSEWKFTDSGGYKLGYADPMMYHGKAEYFDRRAHHENFAKNGFDDSSWGYYHDPFDQIDFGPLFLTPQLCRATIKLALPPVSIKHFDDRILVDFGTNLSGFATLNLKGKAGQTVKICYSELVLDDHVNLPSSYPLCEYTFKGSEPEYYRPEFLVTGFRYIEIYGYSGTLSDTDVIAYFVHSDVVTESRFECSDGSLNRLNRAARQSFLSNLVNIPTDCPERERRGWTGDAFAVSEAECVSFDLKTLYKQWFVGYRDCQRSNGWVPVELPLCTDDCVDLNWPMACILIPYQVLTQYGDLEFCRENYNLMRSFAEMLLDLCDDEYMLSRRFYSYKDWQTKAGCTPEFLGMAYFYRAISYIGEIADAIGEKVDGEYYLDTAKKIKSSINRKFYHDGSYDNGTQSSLAHALHFGICEEENRDAVTETLVKNIETEGRNTTGFLGTSCILQALSQNGRNDAAYALLKNPNQGGWLWLVDTFGATTFPELYSGNCNSQNHAFLGSAPGLWLYKYLCGIAPEEYGYKKIRIAPYMPDDIPFAEAVVSTNYGDIKVNLHRESTLNAEIDIPVGTSATFVYGDKELNLCSGHHSIKI